LNLGDEGGKVVILGLLVLILVASNVYTYVAWKPTSESSLLRRHRRTGQEGDWNEAIKLLLQQQNGHGHGHGHSGSTPREELEELKRILDQVDKRSLALRSALQSSVGGEGGTIELD
jgi:hypothetical protein